MAKKTATEKLIADAEASVKVNYGHGWQRIGPTAQANAVAAELLNVLRFAVQMDTTENLPELIEAFASRVSDIHYED